MKIGLVSLIYTYDESIEQRRHFCVLMPVVNTRLSSVKSRYFKQMFYWVRMTNTLKGRFI